MSLPNITIPLELPIDIPTLLHPAVVHFVIAIPIVVLLLEIINLFAKKRALSVFSLFLLLLVMIAMGASYFSGTVDGKEAFSLLSPEGQSALKEHKLIGTYLVYISVAMVVLKLLFMAFSKVVARLFFILLLIGFIALILIQGKEGGELVYKYGANNEAVASVISDKDDLQDEYDELKEKYDEAKSSAKEEPKAEPKAKPKEEPKEEPKATEEKAKEETKAEETTASTEVKEEEKSEATEETKTEEETTTTNSTQSSSETPKEETKSTNSTVSLEIPTESTSETN